MSPFITFTDENNTYCLQTAFPNYLGVLENYARGIIPVRLCAYDLWMNFKGTLARNQIGYDIPAAEAITKNMAIWFEYNTDMSKYKTHKI